MAEKLYRDGVPGIEDEYAKYTKAVSELNASGILRERLTEKKTELYERIAEVKRRIREERRKQAMCAEIQGKVPEIAENLHKIEAKRREPHKKRMSR